MNVTLDDTSSQFAWSNWATTTTSGWTPATGKSGYYDSTYHSTSTSNDQVTISFQGTAIYLYGAKHGDAQGHTACRIDNGNPDTFAEPPIDSLQQVLCAYTNLDPDQDHTLKWAANVGSQGTTFDIDFAVITPNAGATSDISSAGVAPTSTASNGVSSPSSSSSASQPSTSASSLVSTSNSSSAPSAQASTASTAASSSSGTAASSSGAQGAAQASGAPRLSPNTAGNANPVSATDSSSSDSNIGAIAGGVAGGVVALALVAFLLWWLLCRRRRRAEERVDPLVGSKPLDLADGGSPSWALPTYAQSQGVNGSIYYASPTSGPGDSRSFSPGSDHPFRSPASAPPVASHASYPYSVNPPSTIASSDIEPTARGSRLWSRLSPPATPSSRQGAASRAASVPESATSRYSSAQPRSEKSPSSLPYRMSGQSTPATAAPSNAGSTSTSQSYKQLYQKWSERNKEAGEMKE